MSSGFKKLPELIQVLTIVFTRKIIYNDHFNPEPISQENKVLCEEFIAEYLLNGRTQKFEILESRLRNKSRNQGLIPTFIKHSEAYYKDREILFQKKHELIPFIFHYFKQRENEISNNQTFEDFKENLETRLTEIENVIGLEKSGNFELRLNRIKEHLINVNGQVSTRNTVEEATTKLNGLDNYRMDLIEAYKHNSSEPLRFGDMVDGSFINQYETPILIRIKTQQ
ncbi:uncharacterized protein OCT59_017710 [Rhizophagus irregularis]|uniref:Uncharacterized protein n=1 Tax=Rhizophagus irregularis (strain DAOM 197198w) TaxID=1432141 RepID=A0A015JHB5_RHIIW|nr:hypothetical protein RirG_235650 [Rhizophagus irregularis DAOM 197198w]UZO25445.1 hypothetical protein OCT59_017710 [Rhizophagus irregularis]GBC46640.1 hypothetical protein GLOIN_2v1543129 [Rhizophagus irregularis DAOM 181602=DAOM 197198]CAG8511362.1 8992_t:CDS:2 [Rhizophagus irregularis]